ncbi:hypothetical protein [Variovorax sp. PAMC 28711]|uniref:hypothetical protein n=1 Tax=Variovorax sp. PAMC 28711 TaxID=1795631 RepID=UPI00078DA188|nr:hypothetical protein [Variovorax sp. PAMC 28711]AMM25116.1 hypothetical protein AX767_12630 [Variovorax sp. PAMC 28711]
MAHTLVYYNDGQAPSRRYNVDKPVGRSWQSRNLRDDTMLVQALLRIFYYELGGKTDLGVNFDPPPGSSSAGNLKVDGYHGPATQSHIERFLDQLGKAEPALGRRNDHAFDPMDKMVVSGKRFFVVALVMLNDFCFDGPGLRSTPLETRASDPQVVPPYLAASLTRVKVFR